LAGDTPQCAAIEQISESILPRRLRRPYGPAAPPASFGVPLRPKPINAMASLQPIIDLGLALKALDVAKLGARIVSLDLPLVLGEALVFEIDSGFAHAAVVAAFGRRGQRTCSSRLGRRPTGADMTARNPECAFVWPIDARNVIPPRVPNDDEEDEDENGDDPDSEEPAVIREPDE
jgi:hypothetical protein